MKQFPFKSMMAVFCLLWWQTAVQAQDSERYPIIPKPQILVPATGEFVLGRKTQLMVPKDSASFKLAADFLRELVKKANGVSMGYAKAGNQAKKNTISFLVDNTIQNPEGHAWDKPRKFDGKRHRAHDFS